MIRTIARALLASFAAFPVWAQVAVQGSTVHEMHGAPGSVESGAILVINTSSVPQVVRLYLSDYLYHADGSSRFDAPGTMARSNASWIRLSARELTVPAGATVPVSYTVQPPRDARLTGSYWSVVMVEAAPPRTAASATGLGLSAQIRYGVQIISHMPSASARHVAIRSGSLASDSTGASLQLEIENDGDRATPFTVTTEVFDANGVVRSRLHQERGITLPGSSLQHQVALGELPAGTYRAVVVIDAGQGAVTGAQYTLELRGSR